MSIRPPTQGRSPIGTAVINGRTVEVTLSDEWARYFGSLNDLTASHNATLTESAQHSALYLEDGEAGETIPGQQGLQGDRGRDAPFLGFMYDAPDDVPMMTPPQQDGVWIPLAQKDASGGVPALTLFKLNLKNAAGTFVNWITNTTTAVRTWTMPDKDGTVAVLSDFASPPAIGNTTASTGAFTTLTASTTVTVGTGAAGSGVTVNGSNSGTAGGAVLFVRNSGTAIIAIGNKSGVLGGAYDATPLLWYGTGALATSGSVIVELNLEVKNGFACNGKPAQAAAPVNAAATDLPTVIALTNQLRAALIATGIAI